VLLSQSWRGSQPLLTRTLHQAGMSGFGDAVVAIEPVIAPANRC
jgi:hypothetical protein